MAEGTDVITNLLPSIISGGASAYSAHEGVEAAKIGAEAAIENTTATNAANLQIAKENREYQARLSSSAYSRSVADMKHAGINPAVALAGAGGPASTPTSQAPHMESSAREIMAASIEMARIKKDMVEQGARTAKDFGEALLSRNLAQKTDQETASAKEHTRQLAAEADIAEFRRETAERRAIWERKYPNFTGGADALWSRVAGPLGAIGTGVIGGKVAGKLLSTSKQTSDIQNALRKSESPLSEAAAESRRRAAARKAASKSNADYFSNYDIGEYGF